MTPPDAFSAFCRKAGVAPDPDALDRLGAFVDRIAVTGRRQNLVADPTPETVWMRHVADSLAIVPHLGGAFPLIDVGSGAGFPGIPLAILFPDRPVTLLESTGKKARFLEAAVRELGLARARVVNLRAETAAHEAEHRGAYAQGTARAVAPLPVLLELLLPFLQPGGSLWAMKGEKAAREADEAAHALHVLGGTLQRIIPLPSSSSRPAALIHITRTGEGPAAYPRPPGRPAKAPL